MKPYVYILSLVLICVLFGGCRSNNSLQSRSTTDIQANTSEQSNSNTTIQEKKDSVVDKTSESNTQETAKSDSETTENKQVDEFEKKTEVKEEFDENGNLKSRTTTETERGRSERSDARTGTHGTTNKSNSSVNNEQVQENTEINITQETEQKSELDLHGQQNAEIDDKSITDSRWIQSIEWLWLALPISTIVGIVYLVRNGRKKSNTDSGQRG